MNRSQCGSADLIRLLEAAGDADFDRLARAFGFDPVAPIIARQELATVITDSWLQESFDVPQELLVDDKPLAPVEFWQLVAVEAVGNAVQQRIAEAEQGSTALPVWATDPKRQPDPVILTPWPDLVPRLRASLAALAETRMPDVAAIVRQVGSGQACRRMPRQRRRQWGSPSPSSRIAATGLFRSGGIKPWSPPEWPSCFLGMGFSMASSMRGLISRCRLMSSNPRLAFGHRPPRAWWLCSATWGVWPHGKAVSATVGRV